MCKISQTSVDNKNSGKCASTILLLRSLSKCSIKMRRKKNNNWKRNSTLITSSNWLKQICTHTHSYIRCVSPLKWAKTMRTHTHIQQRPNEIHLECALFLYLLCCWCYFFFGFSSLNWYDDDFFPQFGNCISVFRLQCTESDVCVSLLILCDCVFEFWYFFFLVLFCAHMSILSSSIYWKIIIDISAGTIVIANAISKTKKNQTNREKKNYCKHLLLKESHWWILVRVKKCCASSIFSHNIFYINSFNSISRFIFLKSCIIQLNE